MITLAEAQIVGCYVMALLAFALFPLTLRRLHGASRVSGMLLCAGSLLLSLQFAIQHIFRFHDYNDALGWLINLGCFMLVSYLFNIGLLYLMRNGRVSHCEWLLAPVTCAACATVTTVVIIATEATVTPPPTYTPMRSHL